jgi:hypothetical protein
MVYWIAQATFVMLLLFANFHLKVAMIMMSVSHILKI